MNRDQFEKLLLIHGSDTGRWPGADRDAALALAARDSRAKAMLEAARRIDAAVVEASAVWPSGELAARILAAAAADGERAAFDITPAGIAGFVAGSAGLAGVGYAVAAAIAAAVVPVGIMDALTAVAASGLPGGF
ncbi:MAG: hypothetical protein Kow0026_10620 [Oricola sp.]